MKGLNLSLCIFKNPKSPKATWLHCVDLAEKAE